MDIFSLIEINFVEFVLPLLRLSFTMGTASDIEVSMVKVCTSLDEGVD